MTYPMAPLTACTHPRAAEVMRHNPGTLGVAAAALAVQARARCAEYFGRTEEGLRSYRVSRIYPI